MIVSRLRVGSDIVWSRYCESLNVVLIKWIEEVEQGSVAWEILDGVTDNDGDVGETAQPPTS